MNETIFNARDAHKPGTDAACRACAALACTLWVSSGCMQCSEVAVKFKLPSCWFSLRCQCLCGNETSMGLWQQRAEKLCEVVKLRNKLARAGGFEDFYDYKVQGEFGTPALPSCCLSCSRVPHMCHSLHGWQLDMLSVHLYH
jgi:hypothetical protein